MQTVEAAPMAKVTLELLKIAVLLPCYNEAVAIAAVVSEFRAVLPMATIYVYDNNSTDDTAAVAKASGAEVRFEPRKGKGNVIRRMFAEIEADIYIMADGDLTYETAASPKLVKKLIDEKLDMVVGARVEKQKKEATYRPGHRWGNLLFTKLVAYLFGHEFSDILSGYRVFSRRFVKSFPACATGFDTEAELTIHSLELKLPVGEVKTEYSDRIVGSQSKLKTYQDGARVLCRVLLMLKETRPLFFFGVLGFVLMLVSCVLAVPLFYSYLTTSMVPKIPTAILTVGVMLLAFMSFSCGVILDSVCRGRKERKYLHYLGLPWMLSNEIK